MKSGREAKLSTKHPKTLKLRTFWISSEEKSKRGPMASLGKACFVLFTVGPNVGSGCHLSKWWLENLDKWWPISRDTASEHPANQLWLAGDLRRDICDIHGDL